MSRKKKTKGITRIFAIIDMMNTVQIFILKTKIPVGIAPLNSEIGRKEIIATANAGRLDNEFIIDPIIKILKKKQI